MGMWVGDAMVTLGGFGDIWSDWIARLVQAGYCELCCDVGVLQTQVNYLGGPGPGAPHVMGLPEWQG